MVGKVLGERYEILEKIGEGGMSYVYKAKCHKLKRYVAVKVLKDSFTSNEEIVEKFKREATAIANLTNPNIVNILDVGTQDNIHYIVMEYIKGKNLKEIINEHGKFSYESAISIATKIANALDCAHKNNIIHRDIKPQNVLVTEEGIVKVTDFGIAKSTDSSTIAYTNSVMGSAHYFSPEQAKGTYVDCRTDLYSLGVVLYEMTTGRVPFDGESPVSVALKHIQEPPVPPKNLNSKIPDSLNSLILKSIEKEPIKRYQSAKEMIADLEKVKENPDARISAPKPNEQLEDDHTRIMEPISAEAIKQAALKNNSKVQKNSYEEDEEDDGDYYDEDEDEKLTPQKRKKKIRNRILVGLLFVLLIALGVTSAAIYGKIKSPANATVTVPDVIGKTKDEAKSMIEAQGLVFVDGGTEKSDKAEGTVTQVSPGVGQSVNKNSQVKVITSGGVATVKVPDLVTPKLDQTAAAQVLTNAGLSLGNVTEEFSDTVDKGIIIRQNPAAGQDIDPSTKIDIVVSKGKEVKIVTVPEVVKYTPDAAKTILEGQSLTMSVTEVETSDYNNKDMDGKIFSQEIPKGTQVKEGSVIKVSVYKYVPKKVDLTKLVGQTKDYAETYLSQNNIAVNFDNPSLPKDSIVQSVNPSTASPGDSVTIKLKPAGTKTGQ